VICIGIDIGVTGAAACIDLYGRATVADLPTVAVDGKRVVKRKVSAAGLADLLRAWVPASEPALVAFEDVHMGIGKGGAARSSLDQNRGRIEAVIELLRMDGRAVQPTTWKRRYGLIGGVKADNLRKARELAPECSHMLTRAKDHNRADALLIALWLRACHA